MDSTDPGEIWRLRKEYHSLQRQLRSGQQKLKSRIRLLNQSDHRKRSSQRLIHQKYETKTSTPKVNSGKRPGGASRRKVTPSRRAALIGLQQSHIRAPRPIRNKYSPRRKKLITVPTTASESDSFDVSNTSETTSQSEMLSSDGSTTLRCPPKRRSERLKRLARSQEKENLSRCFGKTGNSHAKGKRGSVRFSGSGIKNGNILSDDLNEDMNGRTVPDVTPQPKSILLTPGTRRRGKTPSRVAFVEKLNQCSVGRRPVSAKDRSLLGYDWIAGILESGSNCATQSDGFFEDICDFRRTHREDCVHDTVSDLSMTPTESEDVQQTAESDETLNSSHKCIHNYTVNDRLFPVALNGASDGESMCAICHARKKSQVSRKSPAFIRVSIPRSTLVSPYRVKSHRRRSYDPTDSLGLSQHCLAGWQSSKPSMMPTASTMDLKSSIGPAIARSNFDPLEENLPPTRRVPRMSRRTQELMNRSLAIQLDAQELHSKIRNPTRHGPRQSRQGPSSSQARPTLI